MRKKLVSLLLTSCLAIGLISTTALAKDETLSKTVTTYRANLYGGSYETTVNVNVTDIPEDGTLEGKTVDVPNSIKKIEEVLNKNWDYTNI